LAPELGNHSGTNMADETLLLVDDDAVSLKMTAAVLRSEG
jgi:hypothetical protein